MTEQFRLQDQSALEVENKEFRGVLNFFAETGTEGGYWAFQDERFIFPPNREYDQEHWSYEGLHILDDGDQLTIYSKENPQDVVFDGEIKLNHYSVFSQTASGLWIHADQEGVDRDKWAQWFFERFPAKVVTMPENKSPLNS